MRARHCMCPSGYLEQKHPIHYLVQTLKLLILPDSESELLVEALTSFALSISEEYCYCLSTQSEQPDRDGRRLRDRKYSRFGNQFTYGCHPCSDYHCSHWPLFTLNTTIFAGAGP